MAILCIYLANTRYCRYVEKLCWIIPDFSHCSRSCIRIYILKNQIDFAYQVGYELTLKLKLFLLYSQWLGFIHISEFNKFKNITNSWKILMSFTFLLFQLKSIWKLWAIQFYKARRLVILLNVANKVKLQSPFCIIAMFYVSSSFQGEILLLFFFQILGSMKRL